MPVINVTYHQLKDIIRALEHQIDRMVQLDTEASKTKAHKLAALRKILHKAPRPEEQGKILHAVRAVKQERKPQQWNSMEQI